MDLFSSLTERFGHETKQPQRQNQRRFPMRKTALTALSTALILGVLGAGSLALASDNDRDGGGYKIGPLGQVFGDWNSNANAGRNAYGFAPSIQAKQPVHKHTTHAR